MLPVIVAGHHDDLAMGGLEENFFQQSEPFSGAVGVRRQPEVQGHDGGLMALHLGERSCPVTRNQDIVVLETPAQLGLQSRVIFNDQQFP